MKRLIIPFLLVFLCVPNLFGQTQDSVAKARQETYLEISHRQKKTGAILLGSGAAITLIGAITYTPPEPNTFDLGGSDFSYAAITIGVVTMIVSVPFFISSGTNKRKARLIDVSLAPQPYINAEMTGLALKPQPAVKIAFNF